tara:strand:+ start:574 stop:1017 length:444 start_codon:yes stop_codon:yes gene_type:complete
MALNVVMTGSGTIGDIVPGWSVSEFATPVVAGIYASGTGDVSITAAARNDSFFIINNDIVSTYTDVDGVDHNITGVVRGVSQQGLNVSFGHSTVLEKFNAEKVIPPLMMGSPWSALDLLTQLNGEIRLIPRLAGETPLVPSGEVILF